MNDEIRAALENDRTIDIVTTGARTGLPRTTEIWFTKIDDRIIICGTPDAAGKSGRRVIRDWLVNLKANPDLIFVLKQSASMRLEARAVLIEDPHDRRRVMSAPETQWYRDHVASVEDLVEGSPIVEIFFRDFAYCG